MIEEFQAGYLPIREGTSLRSFLSKMLNCKPKRISKKFEGSDYNGKQVYVSQPYKLTAEEARERRERLCTLESKFHQSVAELKNAEGMKHQGIDGRLGAATAGLDSSHRSGGGAVGVAAGVPAASMGMGAASMGMGAGAGGFAGAGASFPGAASMPFGMPNDMGGQSNQYLEELAFQDSMLRLRAQQQQQQQQHAQQQQQQQQQNQNAGGGGGGGAGQMGVSGNGSYVDPILGSLALSQNSMNTTPLAASQYWRRQALLEASSHMDSLRMAQAGAIGIQRPVLEPGGLRDLRVPANLSLSGFGGDDAQQQFQQQQLQQLQNDIGKDGAAGFQRKRKGSDAAFNNNNFNNLKNNNDNDGSNDNAKRMRRTNDPPEEAAARNFFY